VLQINTPGHGIDQCFSRCTPHPIVQTESTREQSSTKISTKLARVNHVSIGEIIWAVDEQVEHIPREVLAQGTNDEVHTSGDLCNDLSQQIFDFLSAISLGDLVRRSEMLANDAVGGALRPAPVGVTKQAA
jgi:DNA-binding IscR family transcriptional regulator